MSVYPSVRLSVRLSVCLSNAWIVTKRKHLEKKSSVITNRKSTTSFPMSLRWTAYVAANPPKGPQRRQFFRFLYRKLDFRRRKSATKFLCVKTFSGKVARHSLAYLSVHKWLGRCPLVSEILDQSDPPPSKTALSSLYSLVAPQA